MRKVKEMEKRVKVAKERNMRENEKKINKVQEIGSEREKRQALKQGCISPLLIKKDKV